MILFTKENTMGVGRKEAQAECLTTREDQDESRFSRTSVGGCVGAWKHVHGSGYWVQGKGLRAESTMSWNRVEESFTSTGIRRERVGESLRIDLRMRVLAGLRVRLQIGSRGKFIRRLSQPMRVFQIKK